MSCRSCWFYSSDLYHNLLQDQVSLRERQTLVLSYTVSGSPEEKVSCWSLHKMFCVKTGGCQSWQRNFYHHQSWCTIVRVDESPRLSKSTQNYPGCQSWQVKTLQSSKLTIPSTVKVDRVYSRQGWRIPPTVKVDRISTKQVSTFSKSFLYPRTCSPRAVRLQFLFPRKSFLSPTTV